MFTKADWAGGKIMARGSTTGYILCLQQVVPLLGSPSFRPRYRYRQCRVNTKQRMRACRICLASGGNSKELTWSARSHTVLSGQSKCRGPGSQSDVLQAIQAHLDQLPLGSQTRRSRWRGEDCYISAYEDRHRQLWRRQTKV